MLRRVPSPACRSPFSASHRRCLARRPPRASYSGEPADGFALKARRLESGAHSTLVTSSRSGEARRATAGFPRASAAIHTRDHSEAYELSRTRGWPRSFSNALSLSLGFSRSEIRDCRPSGESRKSVTLAALSAICHASPPPTAMPYTCVRLFSPRSERKASQLPSGAHRGARSRAGHA